MADHVIRIVRVDDALLRQHPGVYGTTPEERLCALTRALASSPAWSRLRRTCRLVVRPESGLVAVIGAPDPADGALLDALGWQLDDMLRRLHPVDWEEVHGASRYLAEQLRALVPADVVGTARLVAVPRGGLIVTGLLAYALGRPIDLGASETNGEVATILVDDCAITGSRLRRWIAGRASGSVIVAVLHAVPQLLEAIVRDEDAVRVALSARPLSDHALARDNYPAWRATWAQRYPSDYWIGEPDHVAYPWNEPDVRVWNRVSGRAEHGWRVVPPEWCMKNQATARPEDIELCVSIPGDLRAARDLVWATFGDAVVLARIGHRSGLALDGSAAAMWTAITETGSRDGAVAALARRYAVDRDRVAVDLDRLIESLLSRSVLEGRDDRGRT